MRVVHLSVNSTGGAGIAAKRTVDSLCQAGIVAELWTNDGIQAATRLRSARWARMRLRFDSLPLRCFHRTSLFSNWSNCWLPSRLQRIVREAQPDLVHLHWIGDGFLQLRELPAFRAPVIWTMHDAWPFTGGCHYPGSCERYREGCGHCPQLGSNAQWDLSCFNFASKRRSSAAVSAWVAPSAWIGSLAAAGGIIPPARLHVLPNACDGRIFRPELRDEARQRLGLKPDELTFVAGALDLGEARKGAAFLPGAVRLLRQAGRLRCRLLVIGGSPGGDTNDVGEDIRYLGPLRTEIDVARVLAASDLLLLPSLQDNLPNLAVEAQACGCPVIAYDSGGVGEIIEPGSTGTLAREMSADGLAGAVQDWLRSRPTAAEVRVRCRRRFEARFSFSVHSGALAALYSQVITEWKRSRKI